MSSTSDYSDSTFASDDKPQCKFSIGPEQGGGYNYTHDLLVQDLGDELRISIESRDIIPHGGNPVLYIPKIFCRTSYFTEFCDFIHTRAHLRKDVTPEVVTWHPIEEER